MGKLIEMIHKIIEEVMVSMISAYILDRNVKMKRNIILFLSLILIISVVNFAATL